MELNSLFDLYRAVAEKLAGRKVFLKFQQPSRPDANGQLTRLQDGRALIEINPNRGFDRRKVNGRAFWCGIGLSSDLGEKYG